MFELVIVNNKLTICGGVDFLKPTNAYILWDEVAGLSAAERKGNNFKGFKDFDQEANARIWP
jgi:hypothetical protein